ncbi:MAG: ABC transporter substrate-binding protein [Acidimicrobiia bacterium]|nr:ABC transporter substrate-binding protein [Acidimicrobiia bacterium]
MRDRVVVLVALLVVMGACTSTEPQVVIPSTTAPASTSTTLETDAPDAAIAAGVTPATTDGITATDDTIYVGVLADLTGPFSGTVVDVVDAQLAFWSRLNDEGGIGGRQVEVLIANTGYDLSIHQAKYAELKDRVVMFAHSTGSQQTLSVLPNLIEDDLLALPVTWYSGWSDPQMGANLLETGSNYCMEAINTISYIDEQHRATTGRAPRLAIITFPDDFGRDSAAGARYAAEQLGMEIVYDGEGTVIPGQDLRPIAVAAAASGADYTWMATDPISMVEIVGTALQLGYTGQWGVAMVSFSDRLLSTALGDYMAQNMLMSTLILPLGAEAEDMAEVISVLAAAYPDRYPSTGLIEGYLEYVVTKTVLERATDLGDLTPSGVVAAAGRIGSLSYGGLAPSNIYSGDAASTVTRATAIYRPDKALFDDQGGLDATLGAGAISPLSPILGFTASDLAASYDFQGPCFVFPTG